MSPSPLISAVELGHLLSSGSVPLLDVRWGLPAGSQPAEFVATHLPGAQFVDLDRALAGQPGLGGRHPLPERNKFLQQMRSAGVDNGRPVIAYDSANATAAARAWWLLRHYGHVDVRVLDGGLQAWTEAGLPTESGEAVLAQPGDFTGQPGSMPVLDADGVLSFAAREVLLDARSGERFRGEVEPMDAVAGHIPSAMSAPTMENVDGAGRFRSAEELSARFRAYGITDHALVGVYCGSGITAAHEVLALQVAGHSAALYPGSWSHWITDQSRPIAIGDRPINVPGAG